MKTRIYRSFLIICMMISISGSVSAQSFWKKIGKGLESIGKELLTVKSDSTAQTGIKQIGDTIKNPFVNTTITLPVNNLKLKIISCEPNDKNVVIQYIIENLGDEKEYALHNHHEASTAFDEYGNQYEITNTLGSHQSKSGTTYNTLYTKIPMRMSTTIYKVSPKATRFSQLSIYTNVGNIVLKNVPIIRIQPTQAIQERASSSNLSPE